MKKLNVFLVIASSIIVIASISGTVYGGRDNVPQGQPFKALQQHWGKKIQCDLDACPRFELVLDGEAVLDRETWIVWEKSPSADKSDWYQALSHCFHLELGGRMGWNLPTLEQQLSLVDRTQEDPALPIGHPFSIELETYWSATTLASDTTGAWRTDFADGVADAEPKTQAGTDRAWCVRGGQSYDGY
jgi:hypothetical protein